MDTIALASFFVGLAGLAALAIGSVFGLILTAWQSLAFHRSQAAANARIEDYS